MSSHKAAEKKQVSLAAAFSSTIPVAGYHIFHIAKEKNIQFDQKNYDSLTSGAVFLCS